MYGPVRTVVWQGSVGDRRPYANPIAITLIEDTRIPARYNPREGDQ